MLSSIPSNFGICSIKSSYCLSMTINYRLGIKTSHNKQAYM